MYGGRSKTRCKSAVKRGRTSPSLEMPKNGDPTFLSGCLRYFRTNHICDSAQPALSQTYLLSFFVNQTASHRACAFCHHHNAELSSTCQAVFHLFADLAEIIWNFRNQDHIRSSCESGMDCDPSRVSSHHFQKHDSMMTFSCSVKAVERFSCCVYSGVKTERVFGSRNIVINGFRHTNYRNPAFHQTSSHTQATISTYNN